MSNGYTLGMDLGTNSLGWALIKTEDDKPVAIEATGVRVFEAGLQGLETDGKGVSRNADRRMARQVRRQNERRARRLAKLAGILQRAGLLPQGQIEPPDKRHALFTELDKQLDNPYVLRARGLSDVLTLHELGRALYHLGQRRGFLGNRKTTARKTDDVGKVVKGYTELHEKMEASGVRTLGEYFAGIDPEEERIRNRYTSRDMYIAEFEKLWLAQAVHHPNVLNAELRKRIFDAIFRQRPLKNQKNLVGKCELEKNRTRAPWAIIPAQRFRYLQTVNNLRILDPATFAERQLSPEERSLLIDKLEREGDMTFKKARKLLSLPEESFFSIELGGEKRIPGNRTVAALLKVFGRRWDDFQETEQEAIVTDLRSVVKPETLKSRGMRVWGLDERTAEEFSRLELEDGYCMLSRKAIEKLLPSLQEGMHVQTAIRQIYPSESDTRRVYDELPPIKGKEFSDLRNPIVERSLTELRKVVNAILRKYGKPEIIRIELARDLRQNAKERARAILAMRENERKRQDAARLIEQELRIPNPSRSAIEKVLLMQECNNQCPYTGKTITPVTLLGDNPQFEVEHIIPFPRCLDDSFVNKTLCYAEENKRKHKRTPFEAYAGTERWNEILDRVKRFNGTAKAEKYRRFTMTTEEVDQFIDDFTNRQLNDTRYAARVAKQYLGLLYGGINDDGIDAQGTRRVQATYGQVTAHIRNELGLNAVLGAEKGKSRDDHRQHAIDAIAVALTTHEVMKNLSDAASRTMGRRLFRKTEPPWQAFLDDVKGSIAQIKVSRRVSKKVRGALHEETFYSYPKKDAKGREYVHVRKPIADLSRSDVEDIVDDVVRERVVAALAVRGEEPKRAFKAIENHPVIEAKNGKKIPIHRVRLRKNLETFAVGSDFKTRNVVSESNHHMELVKVTDKRGKERWDGHVVTMFEAYRRCATKGKEPIIRRNFGEAGVYLFSLACGDVIELDDAQTGKRSLFVVRTIPQSKQIRFVALHDARKLKDISKVGMTAYPDGLRKLRCKKVVISPLGELQYAND